MLRFDLINFTCEITQDDELTGYFSRVNTMSIIW
jgi:hypothetical protein